MAASGVSVTAHHQDHQRSPHPSEPKLGLLGYTCDHDPCLPNARSLKLVPVSFLMAVQVNGAGPDPFRASTCLQLIVAHHSAKRCLRDAARAPAL